MPFLKARLDVDSDAVRFSRICIEIQAGRQPNLKAALLEPSGD